MKFVTGSEAEPVLGYGINPHIVFNPYAISCLPTSNTCTNKLILPVGDKVPQNPEKSYEFFDYAFNSDFLVAFNSCVNGTECTHASAIHYQKIVGNVVLVDLSVRFAVYI